MEEEYDIIQATEEYRERIAEFLRQTYYKYEPLNMAFEAPPNRPIEAIQALQFLKEGTSLIAITKRGLIIGVAINRTCSKDTEIHDHRSRGLQVFHESYTKVANFFDKVEKSLDLWKITGAENSLYLQILAVDPIASGRGIGKKLVELSIEMAKSKGFPFFWTMCSSLYSAKMEEEYDIIPATGEDRERIAEFLRQNFYKYEPLNMAFEAPPNRPTGAMRSLQFLKEGTSLIAITKSGVIIGVAINGASRKGTDIHDSSTRVLEAFHESYTKISNFVDKVEKMMDLWKITGAESSLYLHIIAVDPIASGRGIGKKLVELSIEMAKSKGFPSFWAMCSSHYSAKICRSLGMECVYRLPYKDNKNEAGLPEFLPPAPHTELSMFIQKVD